MIAPSHALKSSKQWASFGGDIIPIHEVEWTIERDMGGMGTGVSVGQTIEVKIITSELPPRQPSGGIDIRSKAGQHYFEIREAILTGYTVEDVDRLFTTEWIAMEVDLSERP